MIAGIVGYGLEFLIETALLFAALWIMIRLQKLDSNVVALLIAAAIVTVVEIILESFLGTYISTSIICGLLYLSVWKITRAGPSDVIFTVAVGTALVFLMDMFLLTMLMGNLRPSARDDDAEKIKTAIALNEARNERRATNQVVVASVTTKTNAPTVAGTNTAVTATNALSERVAAAPAKPTVTATNQIAGAPKRPATAPPKTPPRPRGPPPVDPAGMTPAMSTGTNSIFHAIVQKFALKGVTKSGSNSMALVSTGVRTYPIMIGESVSMQTTRGVIMVRCDAVEENSAVLIIGGQKISLSLE